MITGPLRIKLKQCYIVVKAFLYSVAFINCLFFNSVLCVLSCQLYSTQRQTSNSKFSSVRHNKLATHCLHCTRSPLQNENHSL